MSNPYKLLEKSIGYRFRKRRFLETALTHRSYRYESMVGEEDNQRLEFLGDAVLGLAAGAYLFSNYPEFEEGDLTRIRSRITNTKILAKIAAHLELGTHLRLGRGELKSGGHARTSNLGDALEAVIGAAYLDGGLKAVDKVFKKLFVPRIEIVAGDRWLDNPKGALQEICQRAWKTSPRYRTVEEKGPPHARVFSVEAIVNDEVFATGTGANKREAEVEAARATIRTIHERQTSPSPEADTSDA